MAASDASAPTDKDLKPVTENEKVDPEALIGAGESIERTSKGPVESREPSHASLGHLSQSRKNTLLFIFSLAQFVDICNVSGVALSVAQISRDINLELSQIVWIITSYSLCFAAFLLLAGRLSGLFPAQAVFEGGFMALGILSIITSFVTKNKFGFLILRGLAGISGAMTIPSSYHLAVHMFPEPQEQKAKLSLLSIATALGNIFGLCVQQSAAPHAVSLTLAYRLIAGVCMLKRWTWFFRVLGIVCVVFSALTIILLPYTPSSYALEKATEPRWKRMDVIGVLIMMGALICFILSLTQGPIDGWGSASFIAPFVLCCVLGPLFFLWESRLPPTRAVLPTTIWSTTNVVISSIAVLFPYPYWATSQLQYATYWQEVVGWKPIHVAVAMLPQGIIGFIAGGLTQSFPSLITKPRYTIGIGCIMIIVAEILQVYSDGGNGKDYWKFCFTAFLLGSFGALLSLLAASVNLITTCPPEISGVTSAWVQAVTQVGTALLLGVQAGLDGKSLANWKESGARAYWFVLATTAVCGGQYVIFHRKPQARDVEHELARERMKASNVNVVV